MKEFELRGLNVASSKNSKRICGNKIINSQLAINYYIWVLPILEQMKDEIIQEINNNYPSKIHFYYYRKDKRRFDYANMVQILADSFQKVGILPDDDAKHFIPIFDGYEVDKENPGVKFWVEQKN